MDCNEFCSRKLLPRILLVGVAHNSEKLRRICTDDKKV